MEKKHTVDFVLEWRFRTFPMKYSGTKFEKDFVKIVFFFFYHSKQITEAYAAPTQQE